MLHNTRKFRFSLELSPFYGHSEIIELRSRARVQFSWGIFVPTMGGEKKQCCNHANEFTMRAGNSR